MEKILELATKVSTPWSLAAFAIAAVLLLLARRGKPPKAIWAAIGAVVLLGLVPIVAPSYLQSRAIYRIRVVVLDPQSLPVNEAKVTSSLGGEPKRVEGGWEFDIPYANKPSDGRVDFYAEVPASFLTGVKEYRLGTDFSATTTIPLTRDTSAKVLGMFLDRAKNPIQGVRVGVIGFDQEAVTTGADGNFALPAHAADGQSVDLYFHKTGYKSDTKWVPAGKVVYTIVLDRERK